MRPNADAIMDVDMSVTSCPNDTITEMDILRRDGQLYGLSGSLGPSQRSSVRSIGMSAYVCNSMGAVNHLGHILPRLGHVVVVVLIMAALPGAQR